MKKLDSAVSSIFENSYQTRAVLVLYKNQLIVERYGKGFTKDSRMLGWSMTKSILSTVYGIMQYQGKLSVQDRAPILEWENDDRKEITLHNLLQMNSGLAWDENYDKISDVTKMLFLEDDMTKMQQKQQLIDSPNSSWNYSSGTLKFVVRNFKTKTRKPARIFRLLVSRINRQNRHEFYDY